LAMMLEKFVSMINDPNQMPDMQTAWEYAKTKSFDIAIEESVKKYNEIQNIRTRFPMNHYTLLEEHTKFSDFACQTFNEHTQCIQSHDSDTDVKVQLQKMRDKLATYDSSSGECNGGILFSLITENKEMCKKKCNDAIDSFYNNKLLPFLKAISPQTTMDALRNVVQSFVDEYKNTLQAQFPPFAQYEMVQFMERLKKEEENFQAQLSKIKDFDAQLERETIARMQLAADKEKTENEKKRIENEAKQKELQFHVDKEMLLQQRIQSEKMLRDQAAREMQQLQQQMTNAQNAKISELTSQKQSEIQNLRNNYNYMVSQQNSIQASHITELANLRNTISSLRQPVYYHSSSSCLLF